MWDGRDERRESKKRIERPMERKRSITEGTLQKKPTRKACSSNGQTKTRISEGESILATMTASFQLCDTFARLATTAAANSPRRSLTGENEHGMLVTWLMR